MLSEKAVARALCTGREASFKQVVFRRVGSTGNVADTEARGRHVMEGALSRLSDADCLHTCRRISTQHCRHVAAGRPGRTKCDCVHDR
eukprot:1219892-Prymnesium_polylepis.2